MARRLRIQYPGVIYHVMAHGDGGKVVFEHDDDRKSYIHRLEQVCAPHARNITTDTSWKITVDRGLDILKKYETGQFSLEQAMQGARLTRGVEVTYLKV